jgi:hypothetical protein
MRYYKVIRYGDGEDYSTKETLIDEPTFRQYQRLIAEGKEKIVLEDMVISVSSIKEISPADDIISEYQKNGVGIDGLLEPVDSVKKLVGKINSSESVGDYLARTHDEFYRKMGWSHKDDCICKQNKPKN